MGRCPDTGIDPYDDCGVCNGPGTTAFYYDIDEDGLGDEDEWLYSCTQPLGYVSNADDSCPYDPINDIDQDGVCGDEDNCPDVSNSDQLDTDDDLDGDACDADDDNDGCLDDVDNNPIVFSPDSDEDGNANDCDTDDDNDLVFDNDDQEPLNPNVCSDIDTDGCDDCSSGTYNELNDGFDYDADGMCDLGDSDDDNDGALDEEDSDDNNAFVCSDIDADGCDDCSSGLNRSSEDGFDYDEDGLCDVGDIDDDNDGALDDVDSDDNNPNVCSDNDGDTCDDCTSGSYDVANDGFDFDSDLLCDLGDSDDDNDGALDDVDSDDNNSEVCSDLDGDTCDDCSSGEYNVLFDGYDLDEDGLCDAGDPDDDNDGCLDEDDTNPYMFSLDTDLDGISDDCDTCVFDADNDIDNDGVCDDVDNCSDVSNSDQLDTDPICRVMSVI